MMKFSLDKNFMEAVDFVFENIVHKKSFCLYLNGDLGTGKTYFVKALVKKFYPEAQVTSPTFSLVNLYQDIFHLDLYRIEEPSEIAELGIEDMDKMIVEWPKDWGVGKSPLILNFKIINDVRTLEVCG